MPGRNKHEIRINCKSLSNVPQKFGVDAWLFSAEGKPLENAPLIRKGQAGGITRFKTVPESGMILGICPDDAKPKDLNDLWALAELRSIMDRLSVTLKPRVRLCRVTIRVEKAVGLLRFMVCPCTLYIYDVDTLRLLNIQRDRLEALWWALIIKLLTTPGRRPSDPLPPDIPSARRKPLASPTIATMSPTEMRSWVHAYLETLEPQQRLEVLHKTIIGNYSIGSIMELDVDSFRDFGIRHMEFLENWFCLLMKELLHRDTIWGVELLDTRELEYGVYTYIKTLPITEDAPDLWCRVTQTIDGVERTIYSRPLPCGVNWNCERDEMVLTVTDPEALCCQPGCGEDRKTVAPYFIGADEWLSIHQVNAPSGDHKQGLYKEETPYAGTLPLVMEFASGLRATAARYYRFSVRSQGSSEWTPLATPVSFWKRVGATRSSSKSPLGPHEVNGTANLFTIPYPEDGWSMGADGHAMWRTRHEPAPGGSVPSNGIFELLLQVFDTNGQLLTPQANGFHFINYVLQDGLRQEDHAPFLLDGGLLLTVHVDNRPPTVTIGDITVNGQPVTSCGFLRYRNEYEKLCIEYQAFHPKFKEEHTVELDTRSRAEPIQRPVSSNNRPNHTYTCMVGELVTDSCPDIPYALTITTSTAVRTRKGADALSSRDTDSFCLIHVGA
jgi:hypothetical protein